MRAPVTARSRRLGDARYLEHAERISSRRRQPGKPGPGSIGKPRKSARSQDSEILPSLGQVVRVKYPVRWNSLSPEFPLSPEFEFPQIPP